MTILSLCIPPNCFYIALYSEISFFDFSIASSCSSFKNIDQKSVSFYSRPITLNSDNNDDSLGLELFISERYLLEES